MPAVSASAEGISHRQCTPSISVSSYAGVRRRIVTLTSNCGALHVNTSPSSDGSLTEKNCSRDSELIITLLYVTAIFFHASRAQYAIARLPSSSTQSRYHFAIENAVTTQYSS